MNIRALDKITQTYDLFKNFTAHLKQNFDIDFGYMIVFPDNTYYQIIENLDCLKIWTSNIETSSIFCARNITTFFDDEYNVTIWPETPITPSMHIYCDHNIWQGITISKISKNYTELYWFTSPNSQNGWHRFFIRNKSFLLNFILKFNKYKKFLFIPESSNSSTELFRFKQSFDITLPKSEYEQEQSLFMKYFDNKTSLSKREIEVLSIIGQGYTYKMAAQKLMISPKTINYHLDNIKNKIKIHSKTGLIDFYNNLLSNKPSNFY